MQLPEEKNHGTEQCAWYAAFVQEKEDCGSMDTFAQIFKEKQDNKR